MPPEFEVLPPDLRPHRTPAKRGGIVGWLIGAGAVLFKLGGPILVFGKTALSMLISIGAYSLIFGWKFAAGLVLLILVHEMGHFFAAKAYGIPVSAPMFIPFIGAYVLLKNRPMSAWTNAMISYAGPLAGGLGGWACHALASYTGLPWLMGVASYTFVLNMVNLLPIPPLDGSHIWTALVPKLTPGMTLEDRFYVGLFLAALLGALGLGFIEAHAQMGVGT